ncbi:flavin-containing monooxygenase 5-like [Triplophysa dalaica]|uniref:flavin-containing monooxygenase 5-like n=1 Tax=Triplophysa dalaica TaxID=1582913 RepID=UPI0024E007BB|nr:flavin-containing monooxygenase 5-like [Triplophysa dalaica]XP_056621133.1 flavin-containing monooxygenase 5-like [Triplophysa dalaica]
MAKRVAVIGGGTSGLACIKCCLDEGLEPVCFESSDDIGGLWRFKENPDPSRASIYQSLIINTSKEMMCYSDFPIPAHFPNYMHHSFIMDYFRVYAEHFQLIRHIRFQTKVLHVTPRQDFPHSGQWDVETESKDGEREKEVFDAVMVCTGHHCHPHLPLQDFPGIDTFKGKFFHSREYKTPEEWRGKRVVVIGIGNSGGDIAVELGRMAKQVYLSTRKGSWILNRVGDNGFPSDMLRYRAIMWLHKLLPKFLISMREKQVNRRFNHKLYGLQPAHRLFSQHPTLNDDLPNRILSGTVMVKPNVQEFRGSSVVFEDGTVEDNIDLVVFCTGYTFSFPFLSSHLISVLKNKVSLYKYIFPPNLERPTLAVIGLIQPLGAITPISEIQARWATRVFKGLCKLPSMDAMLGDIEAKEEKMAKRYVATQRHTIQVDYIPYMDEIATEMGVRPAMLKLFLTDPRLGLKVIFGPCTPYQFRLCGPGRWEGARQAILTQWNRVAQPLKTRSVSEQKSHRSSVSLVFSVSVAALFSALYYSRASLYTLVSDPSVILDKIRAYAPLPVPTK